jgi:hypothetical protein
MNLSREVDRATRAIKISNLERCCSCQLFFSSKCKQSYKEEVVSCPHFKEVSYRNKIVILSFVEHKRALKGIKKRRRYQTALC